MTGWHRRSLLVVVSVLLVVVAAGLPPRAEGPWPADAAGAGVAQAAGPPPSPIPSIPPAGIDCGALPGDLGHIDDSPSQQAELGFTVNFFGTTYGSLWVNNNGNVTFDGQLTAYTPFSLTNTTQRIIAPFFADVDTRDPSSGTTRFGRTTYQGHPAFCVNWLNVEGYGRPASEKDSFQLLIVQRTPEAGDPTIKPGDFDLYFNYLQIQWDRGTASSNLGAGVGFAAGTPNDPTTFIQLDGSLQAGAFLDSGPNALIKNNLPKDPNGQLGRYLFQIRDGKAENGRITGTVRAAASNGQKVPVVGTPVTACITPVTQPPSPPQNCHVTRTDANGKYDIYPLVAHPQWGIYVTAPDASLLDNSAGPIPLSAGATVVRDFELVANALPSPGMSFTALNGESLIKVPRTPGGVPVYPTFLGGMTFTFTVIGPSHANGAYEFVVNGQRLVSGTLTEGQPVPAAPATPGTAPAAPSGNSLYSAQVTMPTHVEHSGGVFNAAFATPPKPGVDCLDDPYQPGCPYGPPLSSPGYNDPSGLVRTVNGDPIVAATVTLYRSDTSYGPFVQVPNGDVIMSPGNRANPDLTESTGHFGWDVIAGYYKVRAEKAGCTNPSNAAQSYVESAVMTIPPPVFDLDLRLNCGSQTSVFADVPAGYWAQTRIEGLYAKSVTTGCTTSPLKYCPGGTVTRDQMAVFLVRAKHGSSFTPPTATGVFQDVPSSYWAAAFIEQAYRDGITTGCTTTPLKYCPTGVVTRDQMAVFLVRAKRGNSFTPPSPTGTFTDVPTSYWAAAFIEEVYRNQITTGCTSSPLAYCPTGNVTRDQMAVFLMRTFFP